MQRKKIDYGFQIDNHVNYEIKKRPKLDFKDMLDMENEVIDQDPFGLQKSSHIFEEDSPSIHDSFSFSQLSRRESAVNV